MKRIVLAATALALLVCIFLPLVSVRGPLLGEFNLSIWDVAVKACSGGGDDRSGLRIPGLEGVKREILDIQLPLTGPVLLGLSFVALAGCYLLFIASVVGECRRAAVGRLHLLGLSLGVAYAALFLLGAALTQKSLNELSGTSITQKIASLFSKVASDLYAIHIGAAGIILAAVTLAALLALLHLRRTAATAPAGAAP